MEAAAANFIFKKPFLQDTMQIQKGQTARIAELQEEKRRLQKEIRDIELKFHKLPPTKPVGVSVAMIRRFDLGNYRHQVVDGAKIYTADCQDNNYSFRISVTMKEGNISKVQILLPEVSALREIQKILDIVSEECSPQLLLNTVQHFIVLHEFRSVIIRKMMLKKHVFRVFLPRFEDGKATNFGACSIVVQRSSSQEILLELQWTMVFNKVYQSLAHQFTPLKRDYEHVGVKDLLKHLNETTFNIRNAAPLKTYWDHFMGLF